VTPAAAALLLVLAAPPATAPEPAPSRAPRALLYSLVPGDHLVYRQRLERETRSSTVESRSEAEWESHVLVLAERAGSWRIGIERNRTRADLLRYRENGRDRVESERPGFAEALATRGTAFAETSWLTPSGRALLAWSAVREATSERLPFVHEVEPLPAEAVAPGGSFASPGLLGLKMKAVGFETVGGEECLRLEGESGGTKLRHWHCPSSGTLGRLEYEAEYGGPGGVLVKERYELERVSLSRGETVATWLRDAKTARGALTALAASDQLDVAPEALDALLDGAADAGVERLALAVAWRHRLPPPPADVLRRLASSPSPRVKALAERFSSPRPEAPDALVRLARAVRSSAELPTWAGPVEAGWGRRALLAQRAPGQVPGTTLRFMEAERFRGRPYVLHVPDDYRGDEPFPLVVVLGGGPGRAIPTAQTARSTLEPLGELAVFPQANGMWWEEEPGAAVAALLAEVLAELNVDTDRVTITGFSNGGTGSLLYASRMPHRFAAVASLMGGGLPFFEPDGAIDPPAIARIPFLFVHGDRDELIPFSASERTARAMRKANPEAVAEVHVLPGRRHDIVYGREEGLAFPFLERYARDPFPRRVSLRARSLEYPRAFWAEVVEKGGGVAEIDGAIDGETIALRTRSVKRLRLLLRRDLLDLSQPVRVTIDGREAFTGKVAEDPSVLLRSWRETGDPQLAYSAEVALDVR
jgi:poly(3-hydroxybutyrate) depolymerase